MGKKLSTAGTGNISVHLSITRNSKGEGLKVKLNDALYILLLNETLISVKKLTAK
jgi:hypothetical protein